MNKNFNNGCWKILVVGWSCSKVGLRRVTLVSCTKTITTNQHPMLRKMNGEESSWWKSMTL